jgi:hypothetical protein
MSLRRGAPGLVICSKNTCIFARVVGKSGAGQILAPRGGLRAHDLLHGRHSTLYRSENIQGDPQMMSSRVPRNISAWLGPPPKDPNDNEDENEEDEEDNDDENEEPAVIREPDDC